MEQLNIELLNGIVPSTVKQQNHLCVGIPVIVVFCGMGWLVCEFICAFLGCIKIVQLMDGYSCHVRHWFQRVVHAHKNQLLCLLLCWPICHCRHNLV